LIVCQFSSSIAGRIITYLLCHELCHTVSADVLV